MKLFRKLHQATKAIRQREGQSLNWRPPRSDRAILAHLQSMEREHDYIRRCLNAAWAAVNHEQHGNVIVMADQAQQRLHKLGKILGRTGTV
jgi:hypothetical protein